MLLRERLKVSDTTHLPPLFTKATTSPFISQATPDHKRSIVWSVGRTMKNTNSKAESFAPLLQF